MSHRRKRLIRALIQFALAAVIVALLIIFLNPAKFSQAISEFPRGLIPVCVGLCLAFYFVKGLRWHQLLRSEAVEIHPATSVVTAIAGEALGLIPFGELARGEMVTELTGAPLGTTLAGVTVQELLYLLVIIGFALPGSLTSAPALSVVSTVFAFVALLILVLGVRRLFHYVLAFIKAVPLLRRGSRQFEILQRQTVRLLRRPDTWIWITLSVADAAIMVTLFWVVFEGLSPGRVSWAAAAFVYGAAYLAGAVSSPGGLGGFEGSVVFLLGSVVGAPTAVAAAAIHRLSDKGVITPIAIVTYIALRRHVHRRRGLLLGEEIGGEPAQPMHP